MGKMEEGGASERARERESEGAREKRREAGRERVEERKREKRKEGPGPVALGRDVWRALAWEQNVLDHRETAGEAGARRRELPPAHARPGA